MKKVFGLVIVLLVIAGGSYGVWQATRPATPAATAAAPTRPAELTGTVVSIEGNEIVLAKEIGRTALSEAEQAAKKAEMQKLSEEQRKAAREAETAQYPTENVTLTIPVGTPIWQGTGDGSGTSARVDLATLTKGTYLSLWQLPDGSIEAIKIKGL